MEPSASQWKTYALIGGIAIALVLAVFGLEKLASQDEDLRTASSAPTAADTKVQGKEDASVTLVEYSDFQCPACAAYDPLVQNLSQDFPDDVRVVYRYFPLKTIHKNAMISAKAAEAAHRQGKFWEMKEQLFTHQTDWASQENPKDTFASYAQTINLNVEQYTNDIEDASIIDAIKNDESLGKEAQINGTPSFFINGKKIENPKDYEGFKKLIVDEITAKKASAPLQ